jgi:hypothetical protein
MNIEQAAKLAYGYVPGKENVPGYEIPDHTTQTLRLIVDLTGVVDKALDRVIELERKVKKLETVVDRVREFVPNLGDT